MNPDHLATLTEALPNHPHIMAEADHFITNSEWEEAGAPHIWHLAEELSISDSTGDHNYIVYEDTGHGHIALFDGPILLGHSYSYVITSPNCIYMDKNYYNLTKSFWT